MTARVLVLYASTHGHTEKIAQRIGAVLRESDVSTTVCEVGTSGASLDPADFDGAIVGASIHRGRHQPAILDWIAERRMTLNGVPSAFFSVSLTAADDTDEARASTGQLIDQVVEETGWTPTTTAAFAGAFQFVEYNLPTRVLMHLIAMRHEDHVDVHEDIDYTDWAAVERFATGFAAVILRDVRRSGAGLSR
ncbi:Protoporphyrinogen IX dehydrogenase [menaquinone] [Baekduia alba]|uniref:flavodoxin domain-containing protein n=1 Tax=Baekduia alba TaxID=2997333 RepID=UPI0023410097|nr:flavodoxin domain-containing protein [Baekduia alba]WCB93390.1 Protoporphyrinogen IX dehydrogenase [menaquinone] [Baekduia alba]